MESLEIDDEDSFFDSLFAYYQQRDFFSKLPFNYGGVISLDRDYLWIRVWTSKYTRTFNLDNKIRTIPIRTLIIINQSG